MPQSGLSGQYGTIPYSVLKQKFEATEIDESPDQLDEFMRTTLRDVRPDDPFFESDQKREDVGSEEKLSLRFTGHRSGEVPDRPDMFLELTEKDPRGTALDPNFSLARAHMESRGELIRFYPDDDLSVPETQKAPQVLMQQMRDVFYSVKNRFKIFATSKDSVAAARNFRHTGSTAVDSSESTAAKASIADAVQRNNYTTQLSNQTPSGWDRVGDHEFRVAQYGASNKGLEPYRGERIATAADAARAQNFRDQATRAQMALQMKRALDEQALRKQNGDTAFKTETRGAVAMSGRTKVDSRLADSQAREALRIAQLADMRTRNGRHDAAAGTDLTRQVTKLHVVERMDMATRRGAAPGDSHVLESQILDLRVNAPLKYAPVKAAHLGSANGVSRVAADTARWIESMQIAPLNSRSHRDPHNKHKSMDQEGWKAASLSFKGQKWMRPNIREPDNKIGDQQDTVPDGVYHGGKGSMRKYLRESQDTDFAVSDMADL